MYANSTDPLGDALTSYIQGDLLSKVVVYRDDGLSEDLMMSRFFQEPSTFTLVEKTALENCRGRVLDIGGGAGRYSLALQSRGLRVCAIDISPAAVEIMKRRGVRDARVADIFKFEPAQAFDTLLMMMHGIGIVENLAGLENFLRHASTLIQFGGQIILDSIDVRCTRNVMHHAYQEVCGRLGRYFGETRLQFEYLGRKGPSFGWLQIDPKTLADYARRAGWASEVLYWDAGGDYLAGLTRLEG